VHVAGSIFQVRATYRIQGPIAIRYENVVIDSGFGQGWEKGEMWERWDGPEPCIKYCFNDLILIKIFLIIHSIKIV
jgi:hypothetical protein